MAERICSECGGRLQVVEHELVCIDCLARQAGKRSWTAPEEEVIEQLYGMAKPAEIQRRILKATGSPRSMASIVIRAGRLGLDHRMNQDGITIMDAAREVGLDRWHLDRLVRSGILKTRGRGKVRLLELEDLDRIRAIYPPPPARSYTKTEAMRRLGYSETHITRLLLAGAIRGVRRGERWFVDAAHVDELVAEMRRTGETRREWGDFPHLEAEREKCREYARTRRRQARQEARNTIWYTQSEARRVLGVGRDEMRQLLEEGLVRGRRENGLWLAERAHVDQLTTQKQVAT